MYLRCVCLWGRYATGFRLWLSQLVREDGAKRAPGGALEVRPFTRSSACQLAPSSTVPPVSRQIVSEPRPSVRRRFSVMNEARRLGGRIGIDRLPSVNHASGSGIVLLYPDGLELDTQPGNVKNQRISNGFIAPRFLRSVPLVPVFFVAFLCFSFLSRAFNRGTSFPIVFWTDCQVYRYEMRIFFL